MRIYEKWFYWDNLTDRLFYVIPTINIDLNGWEDPGFIAIEFEWLYLKIGIQINK